jgi:hypothetical protein
MSTVEASVAGRATTHPERRRPQPKRSAPSTT